MTIRESIVASAVNFLQDPNVAGSPIENRVAFLHSKNLTKQEIDIALARASSDPNFPTYTNHEIRQQTMHPTPVLGSYQQYPWQPAPRRDWRDWFIATTIMSSMGYGLYVLVKRYVYPMIAPPTAPQIEQDKKEIDESFEKVFSLLDQLAKDTEELKVSEQSRTTKLDVALTEVETTLSNLKSSCRRREEESRRITDEVHGLRNLIPKAMEEQKETADAQLKELNTELKSLKLLLSQRINSSVSTNSSPPVQDSMSGAVSQDPQVRTTSNDTSLTEAENKPSESTSDVTVSENSSQSLGQPQNFYSNGKASIPSWQLAANRNASLGKSNNNEAQDSSGST
ncbi:Peroxisomal membrane protein PER10 [Erysiphe neolycopersici]|uniref:Peroxisomal membrane protein PEX14 n=1 Tax=Erysiphe neolycopersici TaxID=212602 RepID=A0A420HFM3_9PEZI|nr:Peroxisomal membrane protein PER10 [Erysiphe neolycopersici]